MRYPYLFETMSVPIPPVTSVPLPPIPSVPIPHPSFIPPPPPPPPLPGTATGGSGGGGTFHTVLVTHLPPHLSNSRALRDTAYPCGSTRGIYLACHGEANTPKNKKKDNDKDSKVQSKSSKSADETKKSDITKESEIDDEKEQEVEKKKAVALIRMATTHGANTITRILPMAVKGCCVYNCSSGALLRSVVAGNFLLRQNYQQEQEKKEKKEESLKSGDATQDGENDASEKESTEAVSNTNESAPKDNSATANDGATNAETISKSEQNNSNVSDLNDPSTKVTISEETNNDDNLPPMALRLAQISKYFYDEYHSIPTVSNSIPHLRSKGAYALPLANQNLANNPTAQVAASVDGSKQSADPAESTEGTTSVDPESAANNSQMSKLDVSKVAAAAGGGAYDEEADPLNAPEVLEAVAKFKKKLEERDVVLRKKRADIVEKKLKEAMKKVRKRNEERKMELERKQKEAQQMMVQTGDGMIQQPPLPPPLPPNSELPPPPPPPMSADNPGAKESGKRMVSNLPAWMTKSDSSKTISGSVIQASNSIEEKDSSKKRKLIPSDANYDPSTRRKQRIDAPDGQSLSDIRMANQSADAAVAAKQSDSSIERSKSIVRTSPDKNKLLREWITGKIVEYLGEEEETLIDFIMNQTIQEESSREEILEEMQQVLDEDADDFVNDLYAKILELGS